MLQTRLRKCITDKFIITNINNEIRYISFKFVVSRKQILPSEMLKAESSTKRKPLVCELIIQSTYIHYNHEKITFECSRLGTVHLAEKQHPENKLPQ